MRHGRRAHAFGVGGPNMMTHEIVGRGMALDAIGRLLRRLERHACAIVFEGVGRGLAERRRLRPATLHDWPDHAQAFASKAREWQRAM